MSDCKFIEEIKQTLHGRLLDIWEGRSGLPPVKEEWYRNRWREEAGLLPKYEQCTFLGKETGEKVDCSTCGGRVKFKLFECSHPYHEGRCTIEHANSAIPNCLNCHNRNRISQSGPLAKRHLLCHIMPVSGNGVWQLAADNLKLRWPLFTGRKIFAISTSDSGMDSTERIRRYLPDDAELIEVPNNPAIREVASWDRLWSEVLGGAGDSDCVMYCHAKGVTRPVDPGNSCHWWSSLLWSLMMDHWPLVEDKLSRRPIVGPFKKVGNGFGDNGGSWHYSGSFFWCRVGDFRSRWPRVPIIHEWWGTESWPGLAYRPEEAAHIFMSGFVPGLDLYSPAFWRDTLRPAYSEWLKGEGRPSWTWKAAELIR